MFKGIMESLIKIAFLFSFITVLCNADDNVQQRAGKVVNLPVVLTDDILHTYCGDTRTGKSASTPSAPKPTIPKSDCKSSLDSALLVPTSDKWPESQHATYPWGGNHRCREYFTRPAGKQGVDGIKWKITFELKSGFNLRINLVLLKNSKVVHYLLHYKLQESEKCIIINDKASTKRTWDFSQEEQLCPLSKHYKIGEKYTLEFEVKKSSVIITSNGQKQLDYKLRIEEQANAIILEPQHVKIHDFTLTWPK